MPATHDERAEIVALEHSDQRLRSVLQPTEGSFVGVTVDNTPRSRRYPVMRRAKQVSRANINRDLCQWRITFPAHDRHMQSIWLRSAERFPIYALHLSRNYLPSKTRAFLNFVVATVKSPT